MNYRQTFAEIHLNNLKNNVRVLKSLLPEGEFFCPMIKSFGYGHGDVEVAEVLAEEGIENVGVALVEEGLRLKEAGLDQLKIHIFGPFDFLGAKAVIENDFVPVISDKTHFEDWLEALEGFEKKDKKWQFHLKFNTGMNRLGFSEDEVEYLLEMIYNNSHIQLSGLCSHLSDGEDIGCENSVTYQQINKFEEIIQMFPFQKKELNIHLFNSAGFLGRWAYEEVYKDKKIKKFGVRPGLALFGVLPEFDDQKLNEYLNHNINLKPVMGLRSEIIQTHQLKPGASVSYGSRWVASKESLIGIIPIGYADGYSRHFSNKGTIVLLGKKLPVIGTVCMDYTLVDLTKLLTEGIIKSGEEVLGETVVLFGEYEKQTVLPVEVVAKKINTIAYELLTCIGKRVPRQYLKEPL